MCDILTIVTTNSLADSEELELQSFNFKKHYFFFATFRFVKFTGFFIIKFFQKYPIFAKELVIFGPQIRKKIARLPYHNTG